MTIAGDRPLIRQVEAATARALARGALLSIPTECRRVTDGGVEFVVRVVANLARKDREKRAAAMDQRPPDAGPRAARQNPFLPYEEDLFVADLGRTHVGLLNRYNVVRHHLLMVTRRFESQTQVLTPADLEVTWACLAQLDGLAFYNGGEEAGASQPHRHMQLVPLPLAEGGPPVPVEPLVELAGGAPAPSPALPFAHALVSIEDLAGLPAGQAAAPLLRRYLALFSAVGLGACQPGDAQPGPYNLLITRRWMMMVPRRAERFQGVSFNGLAFAGSLFVRSPEELATLERAGLINGLVATAGC